MHQGTLLDRSEKLGNATNVVGLAILLPSALIAAVPRLGGMPRNMRATVGAEG